MDLDRFKVINDTFGHAAGDELLKDLTALMRTKVRRSDTAARLGGDEFALLLEGCSVAQAHGLPPRAICFEITETAAIHNLRTAAALIRQGKDLGFPFALDDFGIGTSSLGYLKSLPVDFLKIDGSFVRNLEHDRVDRVMTQTINDVAHILGMRTVAEYAENAQIIERLREMGVDCAQGYGIGRPAPLFAPALVQVGAGR